MPEETLLKAVAAGRVEARDLRRAHQRMMAALGALAFLVAVCCVTVAVTVGAYGQQHKTLARLQGIAEQNQSNGERIRSCTEPSGACFRRGQQQTAKAVQNINDTIVQVGVCVKDPAITSATLRACVLNAIKAAGR